MNHWFLAAAATSLFTFLTHVFLGGREVAAPLLRSELRAIPKFTSYYCWHMVTITIAALALAFVLAGLPGGSRELALFATALSVLFMLWNLALIATQRLRLFHFPQWLLFLPGSVLGTAGLLI